MNPQLQELIQCKRIIVKMRFQRVRVTVGRRGVPYHATVKITSEEIIIRPEDPNLRVYAFYEENFRGYEETGREEGRNGLRLFQLGRRPDIKLNFRTPRQLQNAIRKLRILTGSETTSTSSG